MMKNKVFLCVLYVLCLFVITTQAKKFKPAKLSCQYTITATTKSHTGTLTVYGRYIKTSGYWPGVNGFAMTRSDLGKKDDTISLYKAEEGASGFVCVEISNNLEYDNVVQLFGLDMFLSFNYSSYYEAELDGKDVFVYIDDSNREIVKYYVDDDDYIVAMESDLGFTRFEYKKGASLEDFAIPEKYIGCNNKAYSAPTSDEFVLCSAATNKIFILTLLISILLSMF